MEKTITRVCETCQQPFDAPTAKVARGHGRYCSKACATKARWGNQSFEERFWSKVDLSLYDGCWPWKGGLQHGGYGSFQLGNRAQVAHRVAYELARGAIPAGMYVCHRCDNPPCCNPAHLFIGTVTDNNRDMFAKSRDSWHSNPARMARGSRHHLAKLTEAQVVEIRRRYTGAPGQQSALAREYGVTKTAMCALLKRRTWKHV